MSQTQNTSQNNQTQIEMEFVQTEVKQSKRPKSYEEVCARFNASVSDIAIVNGSHYVACLGEGRIILVKAFRARDYYFIKSLMALEINGIDRIIDILTKAKKKYEEEVEARKIVEILKKNPELIKVVKKYLNL